MTISLSRYVSITSGLGGGAVATTRSLVGRLFTDSQYLPPSAFVSFNDATSVGRYFGTASEEYLRAVFYFSYSNTSFQRPQSIQFARWVDVDCAPKVYSSNATSPFLLTRWTSISNGALKITIGSTLLTVTGMDFSAAADGAAVAAIIQAAIRSAGSAGGTIFTSSTVSFSSAAPYAGFTFTGGTTGANTISITIPGTGTDITGSTLLGWLPQQAIGQTGSVTAGSVWSAGAVAETITSMLTATASLSNNFGSFLFLDNLALTLDEVIEAATWNQTQNVMFMYTVGVVEADKSTWTNATTGLGSIGGVGLTLAPVYSPLQYPEQLPMMIEAATDYTAQNSVQNYMYQQVSGLSATVTTNADANTYDALSINYYGQTQSAGALISFYQRGLLQGSAISTNILDMNTYVNEIWLKDAASVALINLLLGVGRVPANLQGKGQVLGVLQDVINMALNNGTISVGKTLNASQQSYISNVTGDNKAWYQVQNSGYWVNCDIVPIPDITPTQYQASYTIIYSKDDTVRKVVGVQTLI